MRRQTCSTISVEASGRCTALLDADERLGERRWSGTPLTDRYSAYDIVVYPRR